MTVIGLGAVVILVVAAAWRSASRGFRVPCPAWLGWILSNPYTRKLAGAQLILDRALLVTVLGEIPDREAAMRALYAALRFGGLLSITELIPDPHYQTGATVRQLADTAGFRFERAFGSLLAYTMNFRKPSP